MSTDLFDRYATLDPAETPEALPDWTSTAPVLLAEIDERTHPMQTKHRPNASTEPKRRWTGALAAAAAAFALVLIVGVSLVLLSRGGDSLDALAPVTMSTDATTTTAASAPTVAIPDVWSPILFETRARAAPPAATCPAGTNPDAPGTIEQARPAPGPWSNQAAVFDTHAGRIVYVDEAGETWTFDVCTNTWQQMSPEGTPYGDWRATGTREVGELVYDVDSDYTIAFGPNFLSVYNANTNMWEQRSAPPGLDLEFGFPGLGAVYDPSSGLVLVVTGDGDLVAYDVETDEWLPIGTVDNASDYPPFMIGLTADTDRLVFLGFSGAPFQGAGGLFDPRSGEAIHLDEPENGVEGGFGTFRYATSGETAYVFDFASSVCRLDPATLDWTCIPMRLYDGRLGVDQKGTSAMVADPINDRLVLIRDFCCNEPGSFTPDDIWALEFDTGDWIQLLAPSGR